jgi:hypothetical protein
MTGEDLNCWNCGQSLADVPRPISRHEQCGQCFEALHCCRLCRHYRPDLAGDCDEERADPPVVKENANFCDWFRPRGGAFSGTRRGKSTAAREELDGLFGALPTGASGEPVADDQSPSADSSPELSKDEQARARLDDLFSKD